MKLCHLAFCRRSSVQFLGVLSLMLSLCSAILMEAADAAVGSTNGFRFIELARFATSGASMHQLPALPSGLQTFHGVPFQLDAMLAVTGMESARLGEFFPTESSIKIEGKAKRIHLLHGTMFADKDGAPLAELVLHYSDGTQAGVRLGYGVHVRDWVAPRLEKQSSLFDPNSQVAWAEADEGRGTASRLFQSAIENPKPGSPIASIEVVSLFSRAAPFILGMTIEGAESALPPNRAASTRKPLRDLREFRESVYRGEIKVRVTDGVTGAPAKEAVISLGVTDDKETYFFGETRADAQGMCRLIYPRQSAVGLSIWVHAPNRVPAIISESRTNMTKFADDYAVALQTGVAIAGVVKDANGKAVPGAHVIIHKVTRFSPHHYGRVD